MNNNNGGPAFPNSKRVGENYMDESGAGRYRTITVQQGGMTLRDYFAAKAMNGYIAHLGSLGTHAADYQDEVAKEAYGFADAMLKARGES